ncbi:hypothetical protein D3C71_1276830 [compost metagenome]
MRLVRGAGQRAGHRVDRRHHLVVDGRQVAPTARHFQRIGHEPGAALEAFGALAGQVAGFQPAFEDGVAIQFFAQFLAHPLADLHDGVNDLARAFVRHQQHIQVGPVELHAAFQFVVEPQRRRVGAALHDFAARVQADGERLEAIGDGAAVIRQAVQLQAQAHDHAQRAFRPDEDLLQVGAHRRARIPAHGDQAAVGQHHVHAEHHVFDLAVARGQLPRPTAGRPAAHGADAERRRPMAHRQPVFLLDGLFKHVAEHAGFHVHDLAVAVHPDQLVQLANVQHDATAHGQGRARHVAASGGHGDRNPSGMRNAHDRLHLLHRRHRHDHRVRRGGLAARLRHHRPGPPVAGPGHHVARGGQDVVGHVAQGVKLRVGDVYGVALQAGFSAGACQGGGIGRRRVRAHHVIAPVVAALDGFFTDHCSSPMSMDFSSLMAAR